MFSALMTLFFLSVLIYDDRDFLIFSHCIMGNVVTLTLADVL